MPLYEYRCRRCGERFERLVRWNADPSEITCPRCSAAEPVRLISLPAGVHTGGAAGLGVGGACPPAGGGRRLG
jgi:putative FmdB family regulatory protein